MSLVSRHNKETLCVADKQEVRRSYLEIQSVHVDPADRHCHADLAVHHFQLVRSNQFRQSPPCSQQNPQDRHLQEVHACPEIRVVQAGLAGLAHLVDQVVQAGCASELPDGQ